MAQIPLGNFGEAVAAPGQAVNVPRTDVSSGLESLAGSVGRVAGEYQARQAEIASQQAKAQAALALATAQNGLHDAHDEIARGVLDGSISTDDAQAQFDKQAQAVRDVQTKGLTQDHAAMLGASLTASTGELQRSLAGVITKRKQSETGATIDAFGEQVQREAVRNGDPAWAREKYGAMLDFTGSAAGFTPEQIVAKKQAFNERSTWSYFDAHANDALASKNVAGLTELMQQVMGPEGEPMDPVRRSQVQHQILGYRDHLLGEQARAQSDADRLQEQYDRQAATSYQAAWQTVSDGQYLSPDAIKQLTEDTAHSQTWAGQTARLLASQAQVAGFATLSADRRAAQLEQLHAMGANPNVGVTPEQAHVTHLVEKIDSAVTAAVKDDPWTAAQKYGVIPTLPTLNLTDPSNAVQLLDLRMQQVAKVEGWVGHPISPLQPREAEQLAGALKAMPPAQAAQTFSSIGQMAGSGERIAAIAKQLGDYSDPKVPMGLAMSYAGDRTEDGKLTAEMILRGAHAASDKSSQVDQMRVTGWHATIATQIRDAFSSQEAEDDAIKAAMFIAQANGGDIDAAVKAATGGIVTRGQGKVPLPVGMDANTFDKRVRAVTPASLASQTHITDIGPSDAPGMVAPGNIDLNARPIVKNADGSVSTVRSIGIAIDGKEVLIPTISDDGRALSNEEAVALYRKTGRNLGTFASADQATTYAQGLHADQAKRYANGAPSDVVYAGRVPMTVERFVATLPDATLVHAGQGLYNVRAGNSIVTNARGQRITLRISQ